MQYTIAIIFNASNKKALKSFLGYLDGRFPAAALLGNIKLENKKSPYRVTISDLPLTDLCFCVVIDQIQIHHVLITGK